jgi:hypothetical protein
MLDEIGGLLGMYETRAANASDLSEFDIRNDDIDPGLLGEFHLVDEPDLTVLDFSFEG